MAKAFDYWMTRFQSSRITASSQIIAATARPLVLSLMFPYDCALENTVFGAAGEPGEVIAK